MIKIYTLLITLSLSAYAAVGPKLEETSYKTYFGSCPSRVAGKLTLKLVKEFENKKSLKNLKDLIVENDLKSKHYLSEYKINYNPNTRTLNFSFDCPKPLMKVQIYKDNGIESYSAILVDSGQLFDPTYEVLLRSDGKLKGALPALALPVGEMKQDMQEKLTSILGNMSEKLRGRLSEVIVDEDNELTIILSVRNRPSSAFLGNDLWQEKVTKLEKIIEYMTEKKKIPSIINLTNHKKVVVKFSDKF